MSEFFDKVFGWLAINAKSKLFVSLLSLVLAFFVYLITKKIISNIIKKFLKKYDKPEKPVARFFIVKHANFKLISLLSFVIAFYFLSIQVEKLSKLYYKLSLLVFVFIAVRIFTGIVRGFSVYTETSQKFQGKSLRSFFQVFLILVYIAVGIIVIGILSEKSPVALLTGLGAATAVISLLFKDTIVSFVSSLQISAYDLIRKGDWISVDGTDIDGSVIEVSLHEIKVQNWDNSVSAITTTNILNNGFKNWRSMQEQEARRFSRTIQIDAKSVKFVNESLKTKLEELDIIKDYLDSLADKYDFSDNKNKPHITNLDAFRFYAENCLKQNPDIHQDLLLIARVKEITERGISFDIQGFSKKTGFFDIESLVLDIVSELLAVLPYFDLKPFQVNLSQQ
ncbi:MAG: mechanosensitive ion channel [Treponemataceae bacterium]